MSELIETKKITEITDEEKRKLINKTLSDHSGELSQSCGTKYYSFNKKFGYPPEENSIIVLSIDKDYKIDYVFIFDDKWKLESLTACEIQSTGLLKMHILFQREELGGNVAREIYIIIRDIYHQHTHHQVEDSQGDILLNPVLANDETEAVKGINEKFQRKIVSYLKIMRNISKAGNFYATYNFAKTAKGEMIYALSFIELFKDSQPDLNLERYRFTYSNTIQAIDILAKDLEFDYSADVSKKIFYLNRILTVFTIFIGVITFIIAVDASLGITQMLFRKELSDDLMWIVAGSWAVIIILGILLLRYFHIASRWLERIVRI